MTPPAFNSAPPPAPSGIRYVLLAQCVKTLSQVKSNLIHILDIFTPSPSQNLIAPPYLVALQIKKRTALSLIRHCLH